MSASYRSPWMTEELEAFRDQFRRFLAKELAPRAEKWRHDKIVDRAAWRAHRCGCGLDWLGAARQ